MENVYGNFNYNSEFIEKLQADIKSKIAELVNKQNTSRKFDLSYRFDLNDLSKLQIYSDILDRIKACDSCFQDYEIKSIVDKAKKALNKV